MSPTEIAHKNLRNLLLNGRILINGNPLTGSEISTLLQDEQMLFEKATNFDATEALAAAKKVEKKPNKTPKKRN